ncbi:MAG: flagellar hook-basal body protein [Firmicutes bacterium]|nr:flagellar hook-basal body protein [Bacillota bacterium]
MLRGLYIAASGMLAESTRNDVIANNLANVNTTGFKKDGVAMKSFPELLVLRLNDTRNGMVGTMSRGTVIDEIKTYHGVGPILSTGRRLDVALPPEGMLALQTPDGERYTRNGSLDVSSDGYLVNTDGHPVLGEYGPIAVDMTGLPAGSLQIDENGQVLVGGEVVDRLRVVAAEDTRQLQKVGNSLYTLADQEAQLNEVTDYRLRVGFLESSNVNPISEMVNLITAMRSFEAGSRLVQAYDSTLDRAVNDIARI